jgi:phage shock protein C
VAWPRRRRRPSLPIAPGDGSPDPVGHTGAEMRDDGVMSNMNGSKVLVRRRDNRILAGVCAGFADYLGMDVNLVRVLTAVVAVFTAGTGLLAYLVAWAVVPEEGQTNSIAEDMFNKNKPN